MSAPATVLRDISTARLDHMDFGSLHIATLWRLTKDGVVRRAVVVEGERPRLVIVEAEAILQWERFAMTAELRKRAVELQRDLKKHGWVDTDGHA